MTPNLEQLIKYEAIGAFNTHFVTVFQHDGRWYVERLGLYKNAYYEVIRDEDGITFFDCTPEEAGVRPGTSLGSPLD